MSAAALDQPRPNPLALYRDDGPIASALGGLGRRLGVPSPVLAAAAVLPLLVAIAIEGDGASDALAGAVLAWVVVVGGLSAGRPGKTGFRWAGAPAIRLAEYAGLLWIASLEGADGPPAAFALLAALAFRHYDLVYRLRHRGMTPPRWVDLAGLGWEGRLLLVFLMLVVGALPAGLFVLAAILAVVFVAESVAGWTGTVRTQQTAVYEEEEDEGQ
jgi:hypothetical protein